MEKFTNFILVDDDHVCNMLATAVLTYQLKEKHIVEFTCASDALSYLTSQYKEGSPASRTILLLDLNMPTLSGWEFLEQFDMLSESIKEQVEIYILSSSVDRHDKRRAAANKNVAGYIEKPLTREKMLGVIEEVLV